MQNSHIVWVFGSSASGKSTFINYLFDEQPRKLLKQLGFSQKELFVCRESLDILAQYEGDPLGDKREEILEAIEMLAINEESVILVKGQDLDLEESRLTRLKGKLPNCIHSIIFLHTDIDTIFTRFKAKPWWKEELTFPVFKEWFNWQIKALNEIKDDFEILTLDSNSDMSYEELDFPNSI